MKKTGMLGLLSVAAALGAIFAFVHPAAMADPEDTYLFIEGEGAQDINGDRIATLAEGLADIDSDGKFTEVEARHFQMTLWFNWIAQPTGVGQPVSGYMCMMTLTSGTPINGTYDPRCQPQSNKVCQILGTGWNQPCVLPPTP